MIKQPSGERRDARSADNRRPGTPCRQARMPRAVHRPPPPFAFRGSISALWRSATFSHGLCFGRRQLTILTPSPLSLTWRLCFPSHLLTSLEMCQLALSHTRRRTFFPATLSSSVHHERNRVVMELRGLPSTKRSHVRSISGR